MDRVKRHWQNLISKKCPNCGTKMIEAGDNWFCPTKLDAGLHCFKIKRENVARVLSDPDHPAHRYLNKIQQEEINSFLRSMGVVV